MSLVFMEAVAINTAWMRASINVLPCAIVSVVMESISGMLKLLPINLIGQLHALFTHQLLYQYPENSAGSSHIEKYFCNRFTISRTIEVC